MDDEGQCELDVPLFIELKESKCASNDLGAYSTVQIGADQFIGSFKGKIKKSQSQCGDQTYVWTILSSRQVPLFYIDASDPKDSNWLRFIRATSDPAKSNVMCMQQNQQINYFTAKEINNGDELLTYLPKKKGKNKNKNFQNRTYKIVDSTVSNLSKIQEESSSSSFSTESSKGSNEENHTNSNSNTNNTNSNKKQMRNISELDEMKPSPTEFDDLAIDLENVEPSITNRNILTDLNVTIHHKFEKVTRQIRLFKCSICSFLSSNNLNELNCLNELKKHYLRTHLNFDEAAFNSKYNEIEPAIRDLMSTLLFKVENQINKSNSLEFKCHICTSDELFDEEDDLREHLLKVHNKNDKIFACLFCAKEFRKLNFFFSHLRQLHKEEIASTQMITPLTLDLYTDTLDWSKLIDLKLNDEHESKSNEIDIEDSNSNDSSSALSSSDKQDKNDDETKMDMNEKDFEAAKQKSHHKHHKHHMTKMSNGFKPQSTGSTKTWTCQMCKKQFDQRVDLSKHQCIELNLKLLKKKKEIRKKKWREAHWKRKIDLSYIETTTLTQLSQNIADNLSFCIDGTNEDLRAYSREVKDYLNTELGTETQVQMFLKCCFPDVLKKLQPPQHHHHNAHVTSTQFLDTNLLSKSNSYFIDSVYTPNKPNEPSSNNHVNNHNHKSKAINHANLASNLLVFNCKNCKFKSRCVSELIQHQREVHNLVFKTNFDCFNYNNETKQEKESSDECINWSSSYMNATSPVGYFGCDPFAYVFNLHWDQTLQIKCTHCKNTFSRPKFAKHVLACQTSDSNLSDEIETTRHSSSNEINLNREFVNINSELNESFKCGEVLEKHEETDLDVCKQVIERILTQLESEVDVEMREEFKLEPVLKQNSDKTNALRISSRLRRSNQKKIENKNLIDKFLNPNQMHNSASSDDDTENPAEASSNKKVNKLTSHVLETYNSVNNRKMYECEKCGLEFTSSNSVIRHQEKSCLRVKVISLKTSKSKDSLAKKCPICAATFFNTHRVSIHIYKHHRNLLGSASLPPSSEAKHLNELQMKKLISSKSSSNDLDEIDESEEK